MLYRLKKLVTCASLSMILGALTPMVAFAGGPLVGEAIKRAWNAPSVQPLGFSHTLKTGCVGDSLTGCEVWTNGKEGDVTYNRGNESDEGTILMLIAREMNSFGAEFCVTQIQIENHDKETKCKTCCPKPWTKGLEYAKARTSYFYPNGAESNCFWLCKNNYYGDKCQFEGTPKDCSTLNLTQSSFVDYKRVQSGGTDVDNKIPMFYENQYVYDLNLEHTKDVDYKTWTADDYNKNLDGNVTWYNNGAEYDTILGITRFASSGAGAFVAPITVRSYRHVTNSRPACDGSDRAKMKIISTPYLIASGAETLVCKDGYKHNASGTDCVPTDFCSIQDIEKQERDKLPCGTTQWTQFDENQHNKKYSADGTCYTYSCKGSKGFKSATDHTCVECTGDQRRVNIAPNGVCAKCSVGYTFNKDAPGDDYCSPAKKVPLETLLYGSIDKDTTKANRAPARVADQCWTFTDEEEYKACVTDSVAAAQQKAQQRLAPKREE